jgi:hypothetical protein
VCKGVQGAARGGGRLHAPIWGSGGASATSRARMVAMRSSLQGGLGGPRLTVSKGSPCKTNVLRNQAPVLKEPSLEESYPSSLQLSLFRQAGETPFIHLCSASHHARWSSVHATTADRSM